jgi:hypothetical protein
MIVLGFAAHAHVCRRTWRSTPPPGRVRPLTTREGVPSLATPRAAAHARTFEIAARRKPPASRRDSNACASPDSVDHAPEAAVTAAENASQASRTLKDNFAAANENG